MTNKVIVKMTVSTNKIGSECEDEYETEYTREEWDALTEDEREEFLEEACQLHLSNYVNANAWIKEDDED